MAQLKNLLVSGASRFIGNIYGTTADFSGNILPTTDNAQSLGDSTHRWKLYGIITGNLDKTWKIKLNHDSTEKTYNGSANQDLGTIYAPTSAGTADYILKSGGANQAPSWYGGEVLTGTTAADWVVQFNGTTESTSTATGAVQMAGGLGVAGQVTATRLAANGNNSNFNLYVNGSSRLIGAVAEGQNTIAFGIYSHAEGGDATAAGNYSHAEGFQTTAFGNYSHAEGYNTTASGTYSHTEGYNTRANHRSQHVFGEYNILDTNNASSSVRGDYVEIVGNGDSSARSNARTLDWSGNETLAGNLLPMVNNSKNIGSASYNWANIYATNFYGNLTGSSTKLDISSSISSSSGLDNFIEEGVLQGCTFSNHLPFPSGQSDGIVLSGGFDADYGFQLAIDDENSYSMLLRQKDTGVWNDWKAIPMADGTNASGTWNIFAAKNSPIYYAVHEYLEIAEICRSINIPTSIISLKTETTPQEFINNIQVYCNGLLLTRGEHYNITDLYVINFNFDLKTQYEIELIYSATSLDSIINQVY